MNKKIIKIGSGSACPGERLEPAIDLVKYADINYIIFDSLSESEMLKFEKNKLENQSHGYDTYMEERLNKIWPLCYQRNIKIIGNMGSSNTKYSQNIAYNIGKKLKLKGSKIATVHGDNVLNLVKKLDLKTTESNLPITAFGDNLIAAHAYIPADTLVAALHQGADLLITGRVGDATLYLAPLRYEFGWIENEWDLLARGIIVGHLFECAGQLSGGYFADPPYKNVPNLDNLGFPIAEVAKDGSTIITKLPNSGGIVNPATCAEQMLYEVGDPANYIHADVVTDFTDIGFKELKRNRVSIIGNIKGKEKPKYLKVNLGVKEGYMAEGLIFYAGQGAYDRAKLAADVIKKRLYKYTRIKKNSLRIDYIGIDSIHSNNYEVYNYSPREIGLRIAGRTETKEDAWRIMHEFETIDNNGPAGIARGLRKEDIKEIIGYYSTLIPREYVSTSFELLEV